jgi:hypothetical protein
MSPKELRQHIESAVRRAEPEGRRETSRLLGACWPGGAEDRTERAALAWVRRWRPARAGAPLPVCSCTAGRCLVCN